MITSCGSRRRYFLFLLLLGIVVSAPRPAMAAQAQGASIIGVVTDESGAILPGVTVTATSPSLQVPEVTDVTNERGEYRLSPLPIGLYQVAYSLSGFQGMRREGIQLTIGFVAKLDIVLKVGSLEETVTVSGVSPIVDVTSTGTSRTSFTKETLEVNPSGRNGLIALLGQAPGVRTNLDVGGNTINSTPVFKAFGQDGEPWETLEGVSTASVNGNQAGVYWDYATLEEANIQASGNNADIPTRGISLIGIVKSGGNDFHGGAVWAQTSKDFQSNNIDDELRAQGITEGNPILKRRDDSGELGGRVVRDKLWFYGSARERIDNAQVLGAFRPDGSPSVEENRQWFLSGKLSYQASKSNKLIGFYEHSRKHLQTGGSATILPEAGYDQFQFGRVTKIEWQSVRGSSLVTTLQTGLWQWGATYTGIGSHDPDKTWGSKAPATTDQVTLLQTGLAPNAGNLPGEKKYHTKGALTWYRPGMFYGNHEFKSGFDYTDHDLSRRWINRPESAGNYQLVFANGVPLQFNAWNYPLTPHNVSHYLGIYGTDSWSVTSRLTFDFGVRYAHDNGFVPEGCSENGAFSTAQCFARVQFNIWNTFAPRVHAAWDITGDGKTVLKGGWGRFDQMRKQTPEVTSANQINMRTTTYRWNDRNGDKLYQAGEVNLDPNGPDFVSITGTTTGVVNPNEKEPKLDEFSAALERQIGPEIAVRVTGVYSNTKNAYKLANGLRPASVYNIPITNPDPGPDGRAGTADDPGVNITYWDYPAAYAGAKFEQQMLINVDAPKEFTSYELAMAKRMSHNWQALVAYSSTSKNWRFPAGGSPSNIAADNPNADQFVNDQTREWSLKGSGAYFFPARLMASAQYELRSGEPFSRTVRFTGGRQIPNITMPVEELGTRRYPSIALLSLRVQKGFRFGVHDFTARLNMYNALNSNVVTSQTVLSGANFLRPTAILAPRILELSATYGF